MELRHFDSVDDFLEVSGPFLGEREAEHNLIFGICSSVQNHPDLYEEEPPRFAVVVDEYGNVVAATLRTPPWNQVLSQLDELTAVDLIVGALTAAEEQLPGVTGPKEAAARFAELWAGRTGQPVRLGMQERIFRLARVIPPRPAPGAWRTAARRDRRLLIDWLLAFRDEADPESPPPDDIGATVDRYLAGIGRRMYLWEHGGKPVSLVGVGGETPNGARIGPVYTPPEFRGRGYASNLTAVVSQEQLEHGRRFCFLFTDLANPTSNKIYQQIGYEAVSDVDLYRFG